MPSVPGHRPHWPSILVPLAVAGVLVAGLLGNIVREYQHDREQTLREAEVTATNLARAFDEHIVRTVQHIDVLLLHLRNEFQRNPETFQDRRNDVFWKNYGGAFTQVGIIDRNGMLLYSNLAKAGTPVNLSDREHYLAHRDSSEDTLFISKPVFGRVSGKWSIQFTRRIIAPDGAFGGVIVISVDPAYLSKFYETIDVGPKGIITLFGTDSIIRARASKSAPGIDAIGMPLPTDRPFFDPNRPASGVYRGASAIDGVVRVWAYRRLSNFPLVVLVALADDDIFAEVEERVLFLMSIGGVASALLIAAALGIAGLLSREHRYRDELEKANAELRYLAETDVLTGAKNRRAFTALAEVEMARQQRHGGALALIMMDLDHFKDINDRHGHAAGDVVLTEVVRRCRDGLRRPDVIGRMGGEEFTILLPETDLASAYEVAERLRQTIGGSPVATPAGEAIPVTVSMGVTVLAAGDDIDRLLSRADRALYRAKDQGRDRSAVADTAAVPA